MGFCVPPLNKGHSEEERSALLREIVESRTKESNGGDSIWRFKPLAGVAERMQVPHAQERIGGLHPCRCLHNSGRQLDVVFTEVTVHNGVHCRQAGCTRKQCGARKSTFESSDLDHYPAVVNVKQQRSGGTLASRDGSRSRRGLRTANIHTKWRTTFTHDATVWEKALNKTAGPFLKAASEKWRGGSTMQQRGEELLRKSCTKL